MIVSRAAVWSVAFTLAALAAFPAKSADWLAWRGPLGTGLSDEKQVPTAWSATENIKWKVPLDGPGNSTPIVVGKLVLITHSPAQSKTRGLRAYDRTSGELVWKHEVEYAEKEPTARHQPLLFGFAGERRRADHRLVWFGGTLLLRPGRQRAVAKGPGQGRAHLGLRQQSGAPRESGDPELWTGTECIRGRTRQALRRRSLAEGVSRARSRRSPRIIAGLGARR